MRRSPLGTVLVTLATVILGTGLLLYSVGNPSESIAQRPEKTLEMRRFPHEPFELIDLKVSEHSVKDKIATRRRADTEGLDDVKFQDADDWPKRLKIKLRNVSGKTVVGLQAYLYFKLPGLQTWFDARLTGPSGPLEGTRLEPGDEVEATVDEGSWERAVGRVHQYGSDITLATVSFTVGIVGFSNGTQWSHGHMLRLDPSNPNKQIPMDSKDPLALVGPMSRGAV
jgi:hypothetical protein